MHDRRDGSAIQAQHATNSPRFEFTDPPFRHSLPIALAFAATSDRLAAVLTSPTLNAGTRPGLIRPHKPDAGDDMVRVSLEDYLLTATAALVSNGDQPRPLQKIMFGTADSVAAADAEGSAGLVPMNA